MTDLPAKDPELDQRLHLGHLKIKEITFRHRRAGTREHDDPEWQAAVKAHQKDIRQRKRELGEVIEEPAE